ncbi:MAG: apolipoprotein N-acyltransferase [Candidatus Binatia bacterium]|nr:apolipoprotein N-acyltransferase [Candidatus Binatia bacterium]
MDRRRTAPSLLAALSGALYAIALPPLGVDALGWVAFAPLFVAVAAVRPGRAFGLGMLWFLVGSFGFASAMPHLISTYFDVPWAVGAAAFLGLTIAFGPLYGCYAAWISWLAGRGAANPLLAAAGLGTVEWARTSAGSIFGWALAAHTQTPGSVVLQSADIGGAYLPGMVLTASAFAIASWFSPSLLPHRRGAWNVGIGLTVIAALAYGGVVRPAEPVSEDGLRVAIVQGGIPHEARWQPEGAGEDLDHYLDLTEETELFEPDLVVWPEYAIAFNLRPRSEERARLFDVTANGGPDLLFGAPYHRGLSPLILQNSAFLLHDGKLAGRYDKNELLPFAERSPLPAWVTSDRTQFTPGRKASPIATSDIPVGIFLCSEGLRPGMARRVTANGATVLANLSNDSWLGTRAAARMQLRSTALRAIENRRYLLRATGSGKSALIGPDGRVLVSSEYGAQDTLFGVVEARTGRTFYNQHGDVLAVLALVLAGLGSLRAIRRGPATSAAVRR